MLAAVLNARVLTAGSLLLTAIAVPRLLAPEEVYVPGMIGFAVAGIVFNGAAALRVQSGTSFNERVVSWHLWEDVLGWVAVLAVSLVMLVYPLPILDPILSLGINLFVLYNALRLLVSSARVFLQSVPASVSVEKIESEITAAPDVASIHDTHVWSLDGEYNVLTTHVVVPDATNMDQMCEIKSRVRKIAAHHSVHHATIEIERESEECGLADRR